MSRSGYSDECDDIGLWRGAVESAIRGKRGQEFLRELLAELDAMPVKRLIEGELIENGEVCAIGSVGRARGVAMDGVDSEDAEAVAKLFNIAPAMAREIVFMNDEAVWEAETPEQRYVRMREWVARQIKP